MSNTNCLDGNHFKYLIFHEPSIDLPILVKKKIIFSDESPFDLGGYVNKQIVTFWAQKTRTHTLKNRRTQNESLFFADFGPEA